MEQMEQWTIDLRNSIINGDKIAEDYETDAEEINTVCKNFPMRIPRYYYNLIREKGDPIWLQSVPSINELMDEGSPEDPLNEEEDSPVPRLTHRYPDRVLLLVTDRCPMYCRFCTRKRMVGRTTTITEKTIAMGIDYIRGHKEIRDVLLSGGDPLMVSDRKLERIISRLRAIPHVEIIRIGTKFPCVLPSRITDSLCNMLKKYHPIYVNTHFNHPREVTPQAMEACERLAGAGIPLGCQTVLIKGVNDDPKILKELMHKLLMMRVRPYYLYQADESFPHPCGNRIADYAGIARFYDRFCRAAVRDRCPGRRRQNPAYAGLCGQVQREGDHFKELRGETVLLPANKSEIRQRYPRN